MRKEATLKNPIYPNLAATMAKHNDTQQGLADSLGIERTSFNAKYRGKSPWKLTEAFALAKRYNKTVEWLFDN